MDEEAGLMRPRAARPLNNSEQANRWGAQGKDGRAQEIMAEMQEEEE